MSSCLLMCPGIKSSLMFSSFGIKPLASEFQSFSHDSASSSLSSKASSKSPGDKDPSVGLFRFSETSETEKRFFSTRTGKRRGL